MLAPNPTRLDADSPPSTRRWRPRRQRLVTMSEAHDQPLLSLLIARQKQTRCSTTRRMNVCRSTPEIGNRRRETGSQGHGVNLASRLENTPTGPANTYRAGQRAASTWSWSDVHPRPPQIPLQCRARFQPGADGPSPNRGRNTDDTHQTPDTVQCDMRQTSSSTTEWHTASQWEAHMTSCCAGTKALPDLQSPMTSATCETSAGSPDARRLGGPAGDSTAVARRLHEYTVGNLTQGKVVFFCCGHWR